MSTDHEHRMARALIAAHVDATVAPLVLDAFDEWSKVILEAEEALERQRLADQALNRYYTVRELMALLRKSDTNVRKLIADGTLPRTQIGGSIVVSIDAVEKYLAEHTSQNVATAKVVQRPRRNPDDEAVIGKYGWLAS